MKNKNIFLIFAIVSFILAFGIPYIILKIPNLIITIKGIFQLIGVLIVFIIMGFYFIIDYKVAKRKEKK